MNSKRIILVAALAAAAFGAHAERPDVPDPIHSSLTRAEVRAELDQFRASGAEPRSEAYNPYAGFRSTLTRAEVTADYLAHRDEAVALRQDDVLPLEAASVRSAPAQQLAGHNRSSLQ